MRFRLGREENASIIAFYSGEKGGTGKTTLSLLASILLCEYGYKVVLLDMSIDMNYMGILIDMFKDMFLYKTSEPAKYGIFDYLLGRCQKFVETLHQVKGRNLIIIPAGNVTALEEKDIDFMKLRDVIEPLKSKNIFVLLDLPAMRLCDKMVEVLKLVDEIVFVSEATVEVAEYAKRHLLTLTERKLLPEHVRIKLIFNKVQKDSVDIVKSMFSENIIKRLKEGLKDKFKDWLVVHYVAVKSRVGKSLPEAIMRLYYKYLSGNEEILKSFDLFFPEGYMSYIRFLER